MHRQVAPAIGAYSHTEPPRWAKARPPNDRTVTQDEPLTGGLCLSPMDPESNFILVAQLAQARDHTTGHALLAPALAPRNGRGSQSTRDAAPGLLASGAPSVEAHPSPARCHGQHALVTAGAGPMAPQERAAYKAGPEAREQLEHVQTGPQGTGDEPETPRPSRPPQAAMPLEHAEPGLAAARREPERLAQQRQQIKAHMRGSGPDDHCVARERGGRRNGPLIAAAMPGPLEPMRTLAQHAGLSQSGVERREQAERVVPKRRAPSACVSGYGRPQVAQLDVTPPVSCALHAQLIPS